MIFDKKSFDKMMHREMEAQVAAGMEEIIEKAKAELEKKLRANIAGIVLSLTRNYDVRMNSEKLIITVENKA